MGVEGLAPLVGRGETMEIGAGKSLAGVSGGGVRSARQRSGGVGTLRRSSSDNDGVALGSDDGVEEFTEVVEMLLARCCAAANWSFRIAISSLASTQETRDEGGKRHMV